ncbi:hypothetical protein [Aeromicrobium sp.]|uniref:hypothetical protein n=1 Tax=Aeromicrobium sp. TaxID=1871063 RepID=UPI00351903C7
MAEYRLTTEDGDVVAEETLEHDQAAVAWRSSRQFEAPTPGEGRGLRLERHTDRGWVRLDPLGTSETT